MMNPFSIRKAAVIAVRFGATSDPVVDIYRLCIRRGKAEVLETDSAVDLSRRAVSLKNTPVLLFFYGYGIVSKKVGEAADLIEKVVSEPENYCWSYSAAENRQTVFSFVRRSRVLPFRERLQQDGVPVLGVFYGGGDISVCDAVKELVNGSPEKLFCWREILRFTPQGNTMAALAYRRFRFPVLGIVLVLLAANVWIRSSLVRKSRDMHALVAEYEKEQNVRQNEDLQRQQIFGLFDEAPFACRYSLFSDRIAACVPQDMNLSRLAIRPPAGTADRNDVPVFSGDLILIEGEAVRPEHVIGFMDRLRNESFAREVRLVSVEQCTDRRGWNFKMEVGL